MLYNCNVEIKAINNYGLNAGFQEELKKKLDEISTDIAQLKSGTSSREFTQEQIQNLADRIEMITRVLQEYSAEDPKSNPGNVCVQ